MNNYYGDFKAAQTVRCLFNTVSAAGVPTSLSNGAVTVSKDGSDVTPSGGVTLTTDAGSVTGRHHVVIDTSVDGTTFTTGSEYAVRLSGSSAVGGTSVVGIVVGEFSIANRAVAPQTGDAYARIGAAGAGLTALGDTRIANLDAAVSTRSTFAGLGSTAPAGWINEAAVSGNLTANIIEVNGVAVSVAGTIDANVVSIAGETATAAAPVAFPAAIGTSTYAGGDTAGVTTLLSRIPGTVQPQTGDAYARIGAAGAGLTGITGVQLDKTQVLSAARALDAIADTSLTLNDALHCAIASAVGQVVVSGTTCTVKTPSTATTLAAMTLDSATAPTSRT